ncbi:endolytic transglycosylase MltG [Clostridium botulinum]|uniref:Endolytic murein transglycosylase n=1 Tax=Clostridium botulinum C/D str. DC5 TaxID=1443128 RepID=A0A0A0IP61_CLOBO|nr:endolytic transglycosylase MltG [Clostridium botulinum]KEI01502.1 aminodeoxychorismate lyase [Clostridium botulinum C/D str. BKT75002]KEI07836.1 aminodeoxychorismate lyase [Clostridium botulinum C/D str. BKT2873]KGM94875.1 aminodeoxychorismate lyase [Clostridium botulinum D str. CCUG 7971]KGN01266.1 aminodeoxychorismate lyase [Clostridium botulinum C/D str. DC5]KOC49561.1 aminodeoxychorismate lyase [Clostridium botulinum]
MKRIKIITVILIILCILIFIGFRIRNSIKHPFVAATDNISVVVAKGDSLSNIINKLHNDGYIKSTHVIKCYINIKRLNTTIKQGKYNINKNISINRFVKILNNGFDEEEFIKVTIPEGYNIENIGQTLEEKSIISKKEFIKSCKEYKLPQYIVTNNKQRYPLEGYLFPDTYRFKKGTSGKKIIDDMLFQFKLVMNNIEKKDKKINNLYEIITKASIIEKEARCEKDRAKIASVINNRIQKQMKLQVDATVLYALGEHKQRLYYKDLKVKSSYNTYNIKGLPPGPICNPGKPSIIAALNPEKTEYLYYVLENNVKHDKEHYFTKDYKDFLKAKEIYKKQIEG